MAKKVSAALLAALTGGASLSDADRASLDSAPEVSEGDDVKTPEQLAAEQATADLAAAQAVPEKDRTPEQAKLVADAVQAAADAELNANPNANKNANQNANGNADTAADPLVAHLKSEAAELRKENTKLALDLANANSQLASNAIAIPLLSGVVQTTIKNMAVALNNKTVGLDKMDATELVTFHKELTAEIGKRFKIGGVAEVDAEVTEPPARAEAVAHPANAAMVGSVGIK